MRIWLRDLRVNKCLSQKELADLTEVDVTSIGKYELGKRNPSPKVARKLAEVLGFEWTRFFE